MDSSGIICKETDDPTLAIGDYVMCREGPRRVVHITYVDGRACGIVVEPVICNREQLIKEQRAACHAAIMQYIHRVRNGEIEPYEAGEKYLFDNLPGKYLGKGRFVGVDD